LTVFFLLLLLLLSCLGFTLSQYFSLLHSFLPESAEMNRNPPEWTGICRNGQESTGMDRNPQESTGIAVYFPTNLFYFYISSHIRFFKF